MRSHVECRVHIIHIFLVQLLSQQFDSFPEPLEMNNFPLPEEFDDVVHVRIIGKPQNIVIGDPCLLLWFIT